MGRSSYRVARPASRLFADFDFSGNTAMAPGRWMAGDLDDDQKPSTTT
jgi:hypothetical protein